MHLHLNRFDLRLESTTLKFTLPTRRFARGEFRSLSFRRHKQITPHTAHCILPRMVCNADADKTNKYWWRSVRFLSPARHGHGF